MWKVKDNSKQAEPACPPPSSPDPPEPEPAATPPKLAGLRDNFPDEHLTTNALNALDAHLVAELGNVYQPKEYVAFVSRRQSKRKIGTGLVFDREAGLPRDFCEWVKHGAAKRRSAAEAEQRR
jgi:hypothetical protein